MFYELQTVLEQAEAAERNYIPRNITFCHNFFPFDFTTLLFLKHYTVLNKEK